MIPFEKCPICGGEVVARQVQHLVRGGPHTASVSVQADVCLHCGERLFSQATTARLEQIRAKLEREELEDFIAVGQSFEIQL